MERIMALAAPFGKILGSDCPFWKEFWRWPLPLERFLGLTAPFGKNLGSDFPF
jgi:hypothetical protein